MTMLGSCSLLLCRSDRLIFHTNPLFFTALIWKIQTAKTENRLLWRRKGVLLSTEMWWQIHLLLGNFWKQLFCSEKSAPVFSQILQTHTHLYFFHVSMYPLRVRVIVCVFVWTYHWPRWLRFILYWVKYSKEFITERQSKLTKHVCAVVNITGTWLPDVANSPHLALESTKWRSICKNWMRHFVECFLETHSMTSETRLQLDLTYPTWIFFSSVSSVFDIDLLYSQMNQWIFTVNGCQIHNNIY